MSQSTSLSSTQNEASARERSRAQRRFRPLRLFILFLIIGIVVLFEPNCFRFLARQVIRAEAWRHGVGVQIGGIDGSLLDPLQIRDSIWTYESGTGPITRIEVASATAEFSWRNLLPRSSGPWFQQLRIDGLTGKIQFPLEIEHPAVDRVLSNFRLPRPKGHWMPAPSLIEARNVDFIFQSNTDYVRFSETEFTLSTIAPGTIRAGQIAIKQPWLNRTFRDLRGTTAIHDAKVEVANIEFSPGVRMTGFSAEVDDLARGQLNLDMRLAAFGGSIRVAAKTLSQQRPFSFEATGSFSQIGLAQLASFLGVSDAAGGTINEGYFTFRGPPQQLARTTARLRLEATNFQWESRQWDTLVLGASLMDGRVQVPELALVQGHNRLNLSGEMPLPTPGVAWWQSDFNANIAARIDNLTELSALMLPEFKFAAGKVNIDGSVRGKDSQFNGQLIVSGSNLRWHNAPVEELHAGVKLSGNELQLTNISLFNKGDYLRGHGVVNIIGDKQYWGEIRASIEDLALYAALLEKPIVPEPLAGGAVIDWSGEGSAKGQSGKFSARLRKLRSLGTTAALLHPINADLDGNYAPGTMQFSRFLLWDDDSSFTANIGVGNKALSIQDIKLYHQQALWLEGDALLPFDVWNAWPNTTLDKLLDDQTVSKVNLTAYNLGLQEASLLTGLKFPIHGVLLGNLVVEGPLKGLKTSGKLTLSKGQIPLGWTGETLTHVEGEVLFEGSSLQLPRLTTEHPAGKFSASGAIDFTNVRDPNLNITVITQAASLPLFASGTSAARAKIAGQIQVAGPLSAASVKGEGQLQAITLPMGASFAATGAALLDGTGLQFPPLSSCRVLPWAHWNLETHLTAKSVPLTQELHSDPAAQIDMDLQITGQPSTPLIAGEAVVHGGWIPAGSTGLTLLEARFEFRPGNERSPSITAEAQGMAFGEPFAVNVLGSLQYPMQVLSFAPPLTEALVRKALSEATAISVEAPDFGLRVAPELFEGVEVVDWPTIASPTAVTPPPATDAVISQ